MSTRISKSNLNPKPAKVALNKPAKVVQPPPVASSPHPQPATSAPKAKRPAVKPPVKAKLPELVPPVITTGASPQQVADAVKTAMQPQRLVIPNEATLLTKEQRERLAILAQQPQVLTVVRRMSAEQRRYAKSRIENIIEAKLLKFKREREDPQRWGAAGKLYREAIRHERFEIDHKAVQTSKFDTPVHKVLSFEDYPNGIEEYLQQQVDGIIARQQRMQQAGRRLLDEIILGGPEDAMRAIQEFEDTQF